MFQSVVEAYQATAEDEDVATLAELTEHIDRLAIRTTSDT
jgi:hypothetical protein